MLDRFLYAKYKLIIYSYFIVLCKLVMIVFLIQKIEIRTSLIL